MFLAPVTIAHFAGTVDLVVPLEQQPYVAAGVVLPHRQQLVAVSGIKEALDFYEDPVWEQYIRLVQAGVHEVNGLVVELGTSGLKIPEDVSLELAPAP